MKSRFARLLLIAVALWLPVQTMAAMAMPLCRHAQAELALQASESSAGASCHEATEGDAARADLLAQDVCDNCEMCHLACAGFIPSSPASARLSAAVTDYVLPAVLVPPSHIAEPPQHPPRRDA